MHLLKLQAECPHCGAPYADAKRNARLEKGPDGKLALACPRCERLLSEEIRAPAPDGSRATGARREGDGFYIAAGCAAAICGICIVSGFVVDSDDRGFIIGFAALAGTAAIVNLWMGLIGSGVAQAEALERASGDGPGAALNVSALAAGEAVPELAPEPDNAPRRASEGPHADSSAALAELRARSEASDYGAATNDALLARLRDELAWRDANTKKLDELRDELAIHELAIRAVREELERRGALAPAGEVGGAASDPGSAEIS